MATFPIPALQHATLINDNLVIDKLVLDDTANTAPFAVTVGAGPFVRGEVVSLVLATGFIAKLTTPPVAGDVLAVVAYDFTNTAAAVTAGNDSARAQVFVSGLLNETALIFGGTATLANCRTSLAGSGINLQVPLAFN